MARWPSLPQAMVVVRQQQRGKLRATLRAWQQRRETQRMATRSSTHVRCWRKAWRLEGKTDLGVHTDDVRSLDPAIRHGGAGIGAGEALRLVHMDGVERACVTLNSGEACVLASCTVALSAVGGVDDRAPALPLVWYSGHLFSSVCCTGDRLLHAT